MAPPPEARVNKACVRCRASKRRCDGARPQCGVCCSLGVDCQFSTVRIPRGPPKGFRAAGSEGVRAKLVRTLETTLRDLVVKLGQDDAETELARLVALRGIRLRHGSGPAGGRSSPAKAPGSVASPTVPTHAGNPEPGAASARPYHEAAPGAWPAAAAGASHCAAPATASAGFSAGQKRSCPAPFDHLPPSKRSRLSSENDQLLWNAPAPESAHRFGRGARSDRARPHSLSPAQAFTPGSTRSSEGGPSASDPGQSQRDRYDGDILGVTDRGDTLHLGSSSGLQLLSGRTLPPLPGRGPPPGTMSLPFGLAPLLHPRRRSAEGSRSGSSGMASPAAFTLPSSRKGSKAEPGGPRPHSPINMSRPSSVNDLVGFKHTDFALAQSLPSHQPAPHGPDGDSGRSMSRLLSLPQSAFTSQASPRQNLRLPRAPSHATSPDNLDMTTDLTISVQQCRRWWGLYWKGFHPVWPILYKPAIRHIPSEVVHEHLEPCLLYAIYAVSSCIAVPGKQLQDNSPERQEQLAKGRIFYHRAEEYIYAARLRPSLSTVQTVFLLAMYSHGTGDLSQAWLYHSLCVSMALDMGLHRWPIDRYDLLYDDNERESRVRLIWLIYVLGLQLASQMGRPVHMKRSDIDMPFLSETEEDDIELVDLDKFDSSDDDNASAAAGVAVGPRRLHVAQCTNLCIPLFTTLEGILFQFHSYGRKEALRKRQDEVQSLVEQFDQSLDKWHASVPAPFRADEMLAQLKQSKNMDSVPLPAFFAVELWFYTAKILLHRNFIPQEEGVSLADILANDSFRKATQAAQVIADMLEAASGCLQVFDLLSADTSYCFFTAAVMCVFASRLRDRDVALHAQRGYTLCRDALARASDNWATASGHSKLLDGFSFLSDSVWDDQSSELVLPASTGAPTGYRKSVIPLKSPDNEGRGPAPSVSTTLPGQDGRLLSGPSALAYTQDVPLSPSPPYPGGISTHALGTRSSLHSAPPPDQQREHMLRWFEQSGEHVLGPSNNSLANSAQLYPPGLFDLEHVYFNECPGMGIAGAQPAPLDPSAVGEPQFGASGLTTSAANVPGAPAFFSSTISSSAPLAGQEPKNHSVPDPSGLPSVNTGPVPASSHLTSDPLYTHSQHSTMVSSNAFDPAAQPSLSASVLEQWPKPHGPNPAGSGTFQLHMLSQPVDPPPPTVPTSMAHPYKPSGGLGTLSGASMNQPPPSTTPLPSSLPNTVLPQASRFPMPPSVTDGAGPSQVHDLLALLQLPPTFGL